MPSGFQSGGVDFDDLFDPDVKGDGPQAAWLTDNGVPLRYAALSYGSKRANVGYVDAGVDVSNLWAAKGTAVYQSVSLLAVWNITMPLGWTGPSGIVFAYSLFQTGKGQRSVGPSSPAVEFNWTSDGLPPVRSYQVRLINVSESGDAVWAFTNLVPTWEPLNSTTGQTLAQFRYNSGSVTSESGKTVTGTLEIRDAVTLEVVKSSPVSWSTVTGSSPGGGMQ